MPRKLKHHEQKLLRKVDFITWKQDNDHRDAAVRRRYMIQKPEGKQAPIVLRILSLLALCSSISDSSGHADDHSYIQVQALTLELLQTITSITGYVV